MAGRQLASCCPTASAAHGHGQYLGLGAEAPFLPHQERHAAAAAAAGDAVGDGHCVYEHGHQRAEDDSGIGHATHFHLRGSHQEGSPYRDVSPIQPS